MKAASMALAVRCVFFVGLRPEAAQLVVFTSTSRNAGQIVQVAHSSGIAANTRAIEDRVPALQGGASTPNRRASA